METDKKPTKADELKALQDAKEAGDLTEAEEKRLAELTESENEGDGSQSSEVK